jgi:hypothetical protein
MEGSFVLASPEPSGEDYEGFLERFAARGNSQGGCGSGAALGQDVELDEASSCGCSDAADDGGQLLFQRDHDDNITTPMRCSGYDYAAGVEANVLNHYARNAYDAVVAVARAAHEAIEGGASECVCERARERNERASESSTKGELSAAKAAPTNSFFCARERQRRAGCVRGGSKNDLLPSPS